MASIAYEPIPAEGATTSIGQETTRSSQPLLGTEAGEAMAAADSEEKSSPSAFGAVKMTNARRKKRCWRSRCSGASAPAFRLRLFRRRADGGFGIPQAYTSATN